MSCQSVQQDLSAIADGELGMSPAIQRHLEACPECAGAAGEIQLLSRVLEVPAEAFGSDPNFVARFRLRLDQSLGMPALWWRSLALRMVPLSLAAVVVAFLFGGDPASTEALGELERDVLATGSPNPDEPLELADWTVAWLGQPMEDSP